ncbi:transcriptional regulator AraC family [Vibrio ponticus]|nr:transcriptional regulator AraC family [Vibrio ponticus]
MEVGDTRFLAPPHLAIWVPPGVMHKSYNRKPLSYCSLNVALDLTGSFLIKPALFA